MLGLTFQIFPSKILIILPFLLILIISLIILLKLIISEFKNQSSEQEILICLFGVIFFLLLSVILGMSIMS